VSLMKIQNKILQDRYKMNDEYYYGTQPSIDDVSFSDIEEYLQPKITDFFPRKQ
jgi:hypothetical protein